MFLLDRKKKTRGKKNVVVIVVAVWCFYFIVEYIKYPAYCSSIFFSDIGIRILPGEQNRSPSLLRVLCVFYVSSGG